MRDILDEKQTSKMKKKKKNLAFIRAQAEPYLESGLALDLRPGLTLPDRE
jgi:hypothetical protein